MTQRKNVSDATAQVIDEEVRRLVEEGEAKAREILSSRIDDLHALAKALLEYETLSGEEAKAVIRGEPIRTGDSDGAVPPRPRASVPSSGRPKPTGPGITLEPEPQPGS